MQLQYYGWVSRATRTDPTYSRARTTKTGCSVPYAVFVFGIVHGHVGVFYFYVSFLLPESRQTPAETMRVATAAVSAAAAAAVSVVAASTVQCK